MTNAAISTVMMSKQTNMAKAFGNLFRSSALQTGYNTMPINNPKKRGINNVFPRKSIKPTSTTICRYLKRSGFFAKWREFAIELLFNL